MLVTHLLTNYASNIRHQHRCKNYWSFQSCSKFSVLVYLKIVFKSLAWRLVSKWDGVKLNGQDRPLNIGSNRLLYDKVFIKTVYLPLFCPNQEKPSLPDVSHKINDSLFCTLFSIHWVFIFDSADKLANPGISLWFQWSIRRDFSSPPCPIQIKSHLNIAPICPEVQIFIVPKWFNLDAYKIGRSPELGLGPK